MAMLDGSKPGEWSKEHSRPTGQKRQMPECKKEHEFGDKESKFADTFMRADITRLRNPQQKSQQEAMLGVTQSPSKSALKHKGALS